MKYIQNYHDYLRENKQFINHQNSEEMNEGIKHWFATFLMLVNLGIVPPAVMASKSDTTKMEFVQSEETLEKVASKFESYFNKNKFYNSPNLAWEDFQKVYGKSNYELSELLKSTSIKNGDSESYDINTDIPTAKNYVNDYGEFILQSKEDELNKIISDFAKQSEIEIAIVTVNTFGNETYMSSFAQNVFEGWGIGKSSSDNGILIALSEADREWRVQTGYGVEGILPDLICGRLGESLLVPAMKEGNYEKGIEDLVNGMIAEINSKGKNAAEIQLFKDNIQKEKDIRNEKIKQGFLTTLEIAGLLAIMGLLIGIVIKRYKKDKALKERCQALLDDIRLYMNKFKEESDNPKDLDYLNGLKKEFEDYINSMDSLPDKPVANQQVIDQLIKYNRDLGQLIVKAEKFNKTYMDALMTDEYVKQAKSYFNAINKIENELSDYGIKSRNKVTSEQIEDAASIVKKNIGNTNIFGAVTGLLSLVSAVKMVADQMKGTQVDLSRMEIAIGDYDDLINNAIKKLKSYGLSQEITKVSSMKVAFQTSFLPLQKSRIVETYKKLQEIIYYAEGKIKEIEDAKRRKRQEEEEEERRARRRREESSRSSYSSSYGSSSSSSSSFGGFGGGSSGGGGAGGRW